ncbi:MAG TPA: hypothetical protein VHY75_07935 [Steroidobacteraceae bacterium]|jgi:hypothetical protein|nr:hypothetical protein [Steroidobacteraceae bacterium]
MKSPAPAVSLACVLAVALLSAGAALSDDATAPSPAPAPGAWQSHKYSFQFLGFTSTYSCDGLADKLRILLLASGARKDVKSQPGACASSFGRPDKFARADLTFSTLAPVPGNFMPDGKPVYGTWRSVALTSHSPSELRLGDCELVEQFRDQVLPMFTTRKVVSKTTCIPNQESGSTIDLKFEVFAPVPAPKR